MCVFTFFLKTCSYEETLIYMRVPLKGEHYQSEMPSDDVWFLFESMFLKPFLCVILLFPCKSKFQGWLTCNTWALMPFLCQFEFIGHWVLDGEYFLTFN